MLRTAAIHQLLELFTFTPSSSRRRRAVVAAAHARRGARRQLGAEGRARHARRAGAARLQRERLVRTRRRARVHAGAVPSREVGSRRHGFRLAQFRHQRHRVRSLRQASSRRARQVVGQDAARNLFRATRLHGPFRHDLLQSVLPATRVRSLRLGAPANASLLVEDRDDDGIRNTAECFNRMTRRLAPLDSINGLHRLVSARARCSCRAIRPCSSALAAGGATPCSIAGRAAGDAAWTLASVTGPRVILAGDFTSRMPAPESGRNADFDEENGRALLSEAENVASSFN